MSAKMVVVKNYTTPIIIKNELALPLAIRMMLEDVHRKSEPDTPKEHGNLRKAIGKSVLGKVGTIRWLAKYAMYQENKRYKRYTTFGTGPHFAENAVKEVVKNDRSYFKRAGVT